MVVSQLVMNSLIIGSIYALVACGFSLVYVTNKFMHLAHGTTVVISSYFLYTFFDVLGLSIVLAILLTIISSCLLGVIMYRFIYYPLQKKKASNIILLLASVGLLIVFENLIALFMGGNIKKVSFITVTQGLNIFGAFVTPLQLVIIAVSIVLLISLYLLIRKTKLGMEIRAVSHNRDLASIVGINQRKIALISFIIASSLAAIAGILIGLERSLQAAMGTKLIIKSFTGSIIGGISSVPGSIIGSYILGIAENVGVWFLPAGFKEGIAFLLLFIFLLFKPKGLFVRGERT